MAAVALVTLALPSSALAADDDDDSVAYVWALVSPRSHDKTLASSGVSAAVVEQVQAAAREWLIASGYVWSVDEPDLADTTAARACLEDGACRDKLSLESRLAKIALIDIDTTPGGRLTLHMVVHTALSGTLDLQWVAAFGGEGPGELFRALPPLDEAPTVTVTVLRLPASAAVRVNGWHFQGTGDIVLPAMLAGSYDLVGTAAGYEDTAVPFVAEGTEPVQVRCNLTKKKKGNVGLYAGIIGGAIVVAGGITAAVILAVSRFRPPDTELGHHPLF